MLVPDIVQEVPVEYSMISKGSVVVVVLSVRLFCVPLVKEGVIASASGVVATARSRMRMLNITRRPRD